MSLLYMDGFAHRNLNRYVDYNSGYGLNWVAPGAGSRISGCHYISTSYYPGGMWFTRAIPASAEIYLGIGYKTGSTTTTQNQQIWIHSDTAATTHLVLFRNAARLLELRRGTSSGTLLATGTTVLNDSTWYYIEMRTTIDDATGICQVRLNGQQVNEIDFVGDTRNGGTSTLIDGVTATVHAGPSGTATAVADLYIIDTNGTENNKWLGDVAVRVLTPSASGTYTQLTNSAGNQTNNYSYVDELPMLTTDYVGAQAGSGLIDTYQLANVPGGINQLHGIQINTTMGKSDAQLALSRTKLRIAGTDYTGANTALSTTYREYSELREANPVTGSSWTIAELNSVEIGAEVV